MFRCRDGQCVEEKMRCDFNKDCFDGSDEFDCQSKIIQSLASNPCNASLSIAVICGVHEFECLVDGRCIPESLRSVHYTLVMFFSNPSIQLTLRCDGFYDCYDFSDEQYCGIYQ